MNFDGLVLSRLVVVVVTKDLFELDPFGVVTFFDLDPLITSSSLLSFSSSFSFSFSYFTLCNIGDE
jgi:hypothetical protein